MDGDREQRLDERKAEIILSRSTSRPLQINLTTRPLLQFGSFNGAGGYLGSLYSGRE